MKYRLLQPAFRELRSAARHYEKQVAGLGHDFLREIRSTISRIIHWPEAGSRSTRKSAAVARIVFLTG